jgi:ABC transporter substrate binding protein
MLRRDIVRLGLVGGASLSVSALVRAAQEPPVRIGVLIPVPDNGRFSASFRDGLRDLGWIEGSAFTLQVRQADGTVPASVSSAALAGWKAVASQSVSISDLRVDAVADIEPAVADLAKNPHAGVIVVPHTFPLANRNAVVDAMAKHRVPAMYGVAEMVRSGGLISYGQNLAAQWRMSAPYVDKIMHGTKPADLPVQYATKYSLALNKAAARALGVEIPKAMLERADEIIEQK